MKPGVYTQMLVQLVFAVKYRESLLKKPYREEIFKYASAIVTDRKCKSIIVNGYTDHIHIFLGLHPTQSVSELVRDIKRSTSLFINNKNWFAGNFQWQEGYGAFTYSKSQMNNVYQYILNQEKL